MARGLGLLIALLFVTGCTTTRVSTLWQDPAYTGGPFHKLLVAGVSDRPGVRRSFEDRFVAALETRGAAAVAAWRVLPDQAEPSQGTLLGAARKAGADGLLVTRLMGIREQTVYTPPTFSIGPGYYGAYGGSAGVVWSYGFGAGYYSTYTNVFLEINLYDVRSERLVWSGQSKTFDPADVKQIVEEVPPKVVEALGQAGLLPAPSPGNRPRQVSRSASRSGFVELLERRRSTGQGSLRGERDLRTATTSRRRALRWPRASVWTAAAQRAVSAAGVCPASSIMTRALSRHS